MEWAGEGAVGLRRSGKAIGHVGSVAEGGVELALMDFLTPAFSWLMLGVRAPCIFFATCIPHFMCIQGMDQ